MASGRPIRTIVEAIFSRDLSPAARSRAVADFARGKLAEGLEQNERATGRAVSYSQIVDGSTGRALEQVNPDNGRIVFLFDVSREGLFIWIADALVSHAPRLTGRYADSFRLFAGGRELKPGAARPDADEYVFLSTMPYARKIERGLSDQAPDGVFQAVAAIAKLLFGDVATIKFSYRAFSEFGLMSYVSKGRHSAIVRGERGRFAKGGATRVDALASAAKAEREARTPAIVVSLR